MFCRQLLAAVSALCVAGAATGADLSVVDAQVLKVGPCSHQLRFGVRYDVAGDAASGVLSYRVGVYSINRKVRLHTVDVRGQQPGTTQPIIVPPDLLICDSSIEVRVDDREQVAEANRQNNVVRESWTPPSRTGFCLAQLDKCP
jgi:hypothetical protein